MRRNDQESTDPLAEVKRQLIAEARCPIDFVSAGVSMSLQEAVEDYWEEFAEAREADIESLFVRPNRVDIFDDAESLIPSLHNWRQWGPAARPVFESEVRPVVMLRVANRSEYPKHYPPQGMRIDDIRSATGSRDSLLYPTTTPELQLELLREVIASELRDFLNVPHMIIHIRAPAVVGAALGEDTRYLAYDISFSASLAHAYPIPAKDFPKRRGYDSWLPPPSS